MFVCQATPINAKQFPIAMANTSKAVELRATEPEEDLKTKH